MKLLRISFTVRIILMSAGSCHLLSWHYTPLFANKEYEDLTGRGTERWDGVKLFSSFLTTLI